MKNSWDPVAVAESSAMALWAAVFWLLILTGRTSLYLSPRVGWIVPAGAVLLTVMAIGRLATAKASHPRPVSRGEAVTLVLVCLPTLVVLALPPATLGSFAASQRAVAGSAPVIDVPERTPRDVRISFTLIAAAQLREEGRRALDAMAQIAGTDVSFEGFVVRRPDMSEDEFLLTRFVVSCCIVDAVPVKLRIVGVSEELAPDEWVRVEGSLDLSGEEITVVASAVEVIPQPESPYLWAGSA